MSETLKTIEKRLKEFVASIILHGWGNVSRTVIHLEDSPGDVWGRKGRASQNGDIRIVIQLERYRESADGTERKWEPFSPDF